MVERLLPKAVSRLEYPRFCYSSLTSIPQYSFVVPRIRSVYKSGWVTLEVRLLYGSSVKRSCNSVQLPLPTLNHMPAEGIRPTLGNVKYLSLLHHDC